MGIQEITKVPKSESKNPFFNSTSKWQQTNEVIQITTQNGGDSITDEIPGGGIVQQRIATQEKLIQSNFQLANELSMVNSTPGSSELSISSQALSSEENNIVQQSKQGKYSQIPTRSKSNSNVSLLSSSSRRLNFSKSLAPKDNEKSKKNSSIPRIYKINKEERLVILSENHNFLQNISLSRKKSAQSYWKAIRIDNLTNEELEKLDNFQNKPIALGKRS